MPNIFQRTKWDIYTGVTLKFSDINYELPEKKIEVILQPPDGQVCADWNIENMSYYLFHLFLKNFFKSI